MGDIIERLNALHLRLEERENSNLVDVSVCVDAQIELESRDDRIAELKRQLAENERALNAYMARDGECPSWLRRTVTDEQIKCAPVVIGDAIYAGISKDEICEIALAVAVRFQSIDDLRRALQGKPVIFGAALEAGNE